MKSRLTYSASTWKEWVEQAMRFLPRKGVGAELNYTPAGIVIGADAETFWRHPWHMSLRYEFPDSDPTGTGSWFCYVWPGFVNGRDCAIFCARTGEPGRYVPLTDEDPAGLPMLWRNPLTPSSIGGSIEGGVTYGPGEGYPDFFKSMGVKPPAPGGKVSEADFDPARTREIRACDVVLVTPRVATVQEITLTDPISVGGSIQLGAKFVDDYLQSSREEGAQHKLEAREKWLPVLEPTLEERFFGTAVEPQVDEIKIGTVWMVSPPDWPADSEPDQSWSAFPQYNCFWNLCHASRELIGQAPTPPIKLYTGLVAGLADSIIQGLLTPTNDAYAMIEAFFNRSDFKGAYWNV